MNKQDLFNKRLLFLQQHQELHRLSKNGAAKILSELSPDLFKHKEAARSFLKTVTGNNGALLYTSLSNNNKIIPDTFNSLDEFVSEIPTEPFVIPTGIDKIGIIGDLHSLFFHKEHTYMALEYLYNQGIEALYINGDLIDFYQLSKYLKIPSKVHFTQERLWGIEFLKLVQDMFNIVYYKKGNHENRYEHYMIRNAPAIFEDDMFSLENVLGFDGSHVTFIHDQQIASFGKLNIFHGHEIPGGGLFNIARTRLLKTYTNTAFCHHHQRDTSIVRTAQRSYIGSFAIGCLCKLIADYSSINQWMNGFAIATRINQSGDFILDNKGFVGDLII